MKNYLFAVFVGIFLAGSAGAANIEIVEEAFELSAPQITFPGTYSGSISVRTCDDCVPQRLPLNAMTEFRIGQQLSNLADFRSASLRSKAIYVFYDVKTGFVTRMVLDMPHTSNLARTR